MRHDQVVGEAWDGLARVSIALSLLGFWRFLLRERVSTPLTASQDMTIRVVYASFCVVASDKNALRLLRGPKECLLTLSAGRIFRTNAESTGTPRARSACASLARHAHAMVAVSPRGVDGRARRVGQERRIGFLALL